MKLKSTVKHQNFHTYINYIYAISNYIQLYLTGQIRETATPNVKHDIPSAIIEDFSDSDESMWKKKETQIGRKNE